MKSFKMFFRLIVLLILLFTSGVVFNSASSPQSSKTTSENAPLASQGDTLQGQKATVVRVIDGDTIEVEFAVGGKARVRYIGIDTPESVDTRTALQCFGTEASIKNKELVEGKEVELVKDVSETDAFGRLLRYVYANDVFINEYLVRQGYASASTFPPDVRHQDVFLAAQKEAQEQNKGLWSACR